MARFDTLEGDLQTLRELKSNWSARREVERCELCSRVLGQEHPHMLDVAGRRIVCSCEACSLLFEFNGARYSRIPRDVLALDSSIIDDFDWNSLSVPVNLAFFFFSSVVGRMTAMYPSPAGATEAELSAEAWQQLAERHPRMQQLRPDVEALLVNRLRRPGECYLVPIDLCYELTGSIRKHWSGFSGGDAVWREVEQFFGRLRQQCAGAGAQHAGPAI